MRTRTQLLDLISRHLNETGMSQTKLCHLAGIEHHAISKLKTGQSVTLKTIEKLERVLTTHSKCAEAL